MPGTPLTRALLTGERAAELRTQLAGTDALRLPDTSRPRTLADWTHRVAAHLRHHPNDAATLNARIDKAGK